MAKEMERRFLVRSDDWLETVQSRSFIVQFYLAVSSERSVRLRISDDREARLTLKFGADTAMCDEFEYSVPLKDAREMMPFAIGAVIRKTRHLVGHQGHLYEIDVFDEPFKGLIIAELETQDRVPAEKLPAWVGREITGEFRYSNASLALNGIPEPNS